MKKALLIGLPLLALLTAGLVYGPGIRDAYLLDGQAANDHRLRETATGGKPYHKPIQYRKKDARPAIVEPEFVDAAEAKIAGGTKESEFPLTAKAASTHFMSSSTTR